MSKEIVQPHHICTVKTPWNEHVKLVAEHPSAFVLGTVFYCDEEYELFFCPICQHKFHSIKPR